MKGLNTLGVTCLLGLVASVYCQFQLEFFPLATSNSTSTPEIVTIPDSNGTSTSVYKSTEFPIWSSTTQSTPNVTSSNQTGSSTTPTTPIPTSSPTPSPTSSPTSSPITTSPNPNSTTESPSTSTVPVPTIPPEPVAPPEPWNLTYAGNSSNFCIMLTFAARVDISYKNELGQVVQTGLDIPDNSTVDSKDSHCLPGKNEQVIVLRFGPTSILEVTFHQDQSNNDSTIYGVKFTVNVIQDLFPGINSTYLGEKITLSASNLTLFDTEPQHSYSCVSLIKTNLTIDDQDSKSPFEGGTLETSNLKVQAFMPSDQKIDSFFPDTTCQQDKTDISSTIPIVVGLILLFMVVVVLIAYFIGRSRQQKNTTI